MTMNEKVYELINKIIEKEEAEETKEKKATEKEEGNKKEEKKEKEELSLTPSQEACITTTGKNLLISAAAGSGKTFTLTQRIISSLTEKDPPSDISKMIIVTYTKAAAAELKEKISKALSEALAKDPLNGYLSNQLVKLENAKICTIDSFYFDVLREFSANLGLPQSLRIADPAEAELLEKEIMDKAIAEFYKRDQNKFSHFAECFVGIKSTSRLGITLLKLYSNVISYPEGIEFIRRSAEKCLDGAELDFFENDFGRVLKENARESLAYYSMLLDDSIDKIMLDEDLSVKYLPTFDYILRFCRQATELIDKVGKYNELKELFDSFSPPDLENAKPKTELSTAVKKVRDDAKAAIEKIKAQSFALSPAAIAEVMKKTADVTMTLYDLLLAFEKELNEEKLARSTFTFNDIRRFVHDLFVKKDTPIDEMNIYPEYRTETARIYSERYTDIYIDEYQDVDRVQDRIFDAISNGHNKFMVGDIKQSIYSFRGAEPTVFASYRERYPSHSSNDAKDSPSESIFMSENFRCDKTVIDFTNRVCSYLFALTAKSIGYTHEDDLRYSKKAPKDKSYTPSAVELAVIVPPSDESSGYKANADNNREIEARYIAKTVKELLSGDTKKADGKKLEPSDIAVLYRSSKIVEPICRAFEEAGIEYIGAEECSYFKRPEVLLILSLMNVIDNPHRDIHLAAVLRSPLFSFTLDDLVKIKRHCKNGAYSLYECVVEYEKGDGELAEKCKEFTACLDEWRDMTLSQSVDELLKNVYSSTRFAAAGLCESESLTILYDFARSYESGSFKGLYNFIEYINKLVSDGKTFKLDNSSSKENKVRIMTIHHSKGLEFPVCILSGMSGQFNKEDIKDSLVFEAEMGVAMRLSDNTGFSRLNTPMRSAITSKILQNNMLEEIRVLYVALTRARERLYITGSSSASEEKLLGRAELSKTYSSRYSVMKANSLLDWILCAISSTDIDGLCNLSFVEADTVTLESHLEEKEETCEISPINESLSKEFIESFSYVYPYKALSSLPAKMSVSRLSPRVLDENDDAKDLFDTPYPERIPQILIDGTKDTATAADRGTATHLFFQFCDFERAESTGAIEELARLIERRYLPSGADELVYKDELERFFESALYARIKTAKRIIREQRFNILLPASDFESGVRFKDEMLAVQGVIDLVIIDENDKLCLYDYKTDRLTKAELESDALLEKKMRQAHGNQLSYYKKAIAELFGKECDVAEIYSTHAAKTVKI